MFQVEHYGRRRLRSRGWRRLTRGGRAIGIRRGACSAVSHWSIIRRSMSQASGQSEREASGVDQAQGELQRGCLSTRGISVGQGRSVGQGISARGQAFGGVLGISGREVLRLLTIRRPARDHAAARRPAMAGRRAPPRHTGEARIRP